MGLFLPKSGEIRVNAIPLTQVNRSDWFRHIAYVPQDPFFYDGSIAENVTFGSHKAIDHELVKQVCKRAGMDFLEHLPNGIDTTIGEKGIKLSGGQLQRIAIARALYRNPTIIIFDEATSALDSRTETAIMNAIYGIKGVTLVIIAHRLSTLDRCNKILWIDGGKQRAYGLPQVIIPQYEEVMRRESMEGTT